MTSLHAPSSIAQDDPSARSLFGHRPFLLFWMSRVFSAVAFQVSAVAVG
nr:hypothetical protein [Syntrophobacter fumaroxidans]